VLLTQSGFNGKILNRIVMLNPIAIGLTGHLLKKYLALFVILSSCLPQAGVEGLSLNTPYRLSIKPFTFLKVL
jgi:hypothetical protein